MSQANKLISNILNANMELDNENVVCCRERCQEEIQELKLAIETIQNDIYRKTKQYHDALISNLKKDLKIRELEAKMHDSRYDEFDGIIPKETLKELKSIDDASTKDSNFVLNVVRGLYKNDLNHLRNKTLSGRKKEALTPEKVDLINKICMKRLSGKDDNMERQANISKHIKVAIQNINKLQK